MGGQKKLMLSHGTVVCYNHTRWADWDHSQYITYAPDFLRYLKCAVTSMLLECGIMPEQIHTIFIENPRRFFTGD